MACHVSETTVRHYHLFRWSDSTMRIMIESYASSVILKDYRLRKPQLGFLPQVYKAFLDADQRSCDMSDRYYVLHTMSLAT